LFLPFSKLGEFFAWYRDRIDFFPLWCVPYRRVRDYEWIADGFFDGLDDELFVDIAIYGLAQPDGRNVYAELEEELLRVRGIKTLISYNYYDEETFWRTWKSRTGRRRSASSIRAGCSAICIRRRASRRESHGFAGAVTGGCYGR